MWFPAEESRQKVGRNLLLYSRPTVPSCKGMGGFPCQESMQRNVLRVRACVCAGGRTRYGTNRCLQRCCHPDGRNVTEETHKPKSN